MRIVVFQLEQWESTAILLRGKYIKRIPDWVLHRSPQRQISLSLCQRSLRWMVLIGSQAATGSLPSVWNMDKDFIMFSKSAYGSEDIPLSFLQRSSLSSCWIVVISESRAVNGFVSPAGTRGFSRRLPSTSPSNLHANKLTGFQCHCQSLNLCLSIPWALIWMWMSMLPVFLCVCVFTYTWPFSGLTCLHGQ